VMSPVRRVVNLESQNSRFYPATLKKRKKNRWSACNNYCTGTVPGTGTVLLILNEVRMDRRHSIFEWYAK
jgi:hypothetical protein